MKGIAKPSSIYFSAYPLKAIEQAQTAKDASSPSSPFLRIVSGKAKTSSRVRVFPMINPYKNPYKQETKFNPADTDIKLPADIELTEKQWFRNYE